MSAKKDMMKDSDMKNRKMYKQKSKHHRNSHLSIKKLVEPQSFIEIKPI